MVVLRITQLVAEVAQQGSSAAQSSQLVLEVSTPFIGTAVPLGALSSQLVLEVSVAFVEPDAPTPGAQLGGHAQEGLTGGAARLHGLTGGLEAAEGAAA